jgi:hypothetical protein
VLVEAPVVEVAEGGGQHAVTVNPNLSRSGENGELDEATGNSLVSLEEQALSKLASKEAIDRAVDNLCNRIEAGKRLKAALLSMTNNYDWYSMAAEGEPDGLPYLAETGATKVMHAFGIQIVHDGGTKEPNPEGGYEYVFHGRVRALAFSEAWFPVVGSRWSDDGFFTQGGRKRADPGDVRKAAMTNLYNRAIKLATGIKSLTWDELESVPHLRGLRNNVRKIGFTGGAGGASASAGELSEMQKGAHIEVVVPYKNVNARTAVKNLPRSERFFTGKEGTPPNVWVAKYTKRNLGFVVDLKAQHGDIQFSPKNIPEEDLP